jgi:putative GTP pyrophosphokinase
MDILNEFDHCKALQEELAARLDRLLKELVAEAGIRTHSVTTRVKDRESLRRKVDANPGKYSSLGQVTDVCGSRLVVYFADEIERLATLVEAEFEIDRVRLPPWLTQTVKTQVTVR